METVKPSSIKLSVDNIPNELKSLDQWVCWQYVFKNNHRTKIPINPKDGSYASSTDQSTWSGFATALSARNTFKADGIGFVLNGGEYVGIDLDDCLESGRISDPVIMDIVKTIGSYTEITPSGKGLRIIAKGRLPNSGRKKGNVEFYQSGRYLTITGNTYGGLATIENRGDEIQKTYRKIWPAHSVPSSKSNIILLDDSALLAQAFQSKSGPAIKQLWEGRWEGLYPTQSEADLALCNHLAFWTQKDATRIDQLFRQSKLYREKWERDDYRQETIQRATQESNSYTPPIHKTDLGNAKRMVARHGQDIRYCHTWGKWLVWDGKRWRIDDTAQVEQMAKQTILSIYDEARSTLSDDERQKLAKHAISSESNRRIHDMLALVKTEPSIAINHYELDKDVDLLNVQNGTLDLKTGKLQPHNRKDLITRITNISHEPDAACPKWDAFLDRIMSGNQSLISFLQCAVGYSLTGNTREHVLFFMYGTGANGKSTFAETVMALLGDYSQKAPTSMLTVKKYEGIPNDIARLVGVRFVTVAEVEDGKRLAESVVKDLTGGDKLTARFMRQEWFDFVPTHKLWIYGNHEPVIRGNDHGIWRRIKKIPFSVTIPDEEQNKMLKEELQEELSGILAWTVRGCMEWRRIGLQAPKEVQMATKQYKEDMDIIGLFLTECCQKESGVVAAGELYRAYQAWTTRYGEYCQTQKKFSQSLKERGFALDKQAGIRVVTGLRLVSAA